MLMRVLRSPRLLAAEAAIWSGFWIWWLVALRFCARLTQTVLFVVGVAACVAVVAYITALINGLQSNTITKTLGAQSHLSVRAPDDVVVSARSASVSTHVLTEVQPRAQRLRSVANWQALLPVLEQLPEVRLFNRCLAAWPCAAGSLRLPDGDRAGRYDRIITWGTKVVSGTAGWRRAKQ